MNDVTRYNNRLTVYLDQIFPSCDKAFSNIGGAASRAVLQECPTPPILLLKDENELARMICVAAYKHYAFGKKMAEKLRLAAATAERLSFMHPETLQWLFL